MIVSYRWIAFYVPDLYLQLLWHMDLVQMIPSHIISGSTTEHIFINRKKQKRQKEMIPWYLNTCLSDVSLVLPAFERHYSVHLEFSDYYLSLSPSLCFLLSLSYFYIIIIINFFLFVFQISLTIGYVVGTKRMLQRRTWLLRLSLILNLVVILYVGAHLSMSVHRFILLLSLSLCCMSYIVKCIVPVPV